MKKTYLYIFILCLSSQLSYSQCFPDRHSTNAHDGWVSCAQSTHPNASLGSRHWVMYDFGQSYNMYSSTIWNLNSPDHLDWNIKLAQIHYSQDGVSWIFYGNVNVAQASGDPLYEGAAGPDFGGIQARYLVISPLTNYGGSCFGFGEIRIYTESSSPNSLALNINPCINNGVIYGLNGGINRGGTYTGSGVLNSYEDQFDFDPDLAGAGAHTVTYQYIQGGNLISKIATLNVSDCGQGNCPPCPPCSLASLPEYNEDPILNGIYYEKPQIISSGNVDTAYNVNFRAAESIILDSNFEVDYNSDFHAQIRDCETEVNFLNNGDFEMGNYNPWVMELHETAAANIVYDTNNPFAGNASARVDVTSTTTTSWHIQFEQFGMSVNNGQTYILEFAARANSNKTIPVAVGRHNSPWNGYHWEQVNLTTAWQTYSMTFVPDETNINFVRVSARLSDNDPETY